MKLRSKIIIIITGVLIIGIAISIAIQYYFQNKNKIQLQESLNEVTSLSTTETDQIKKVIGQDIEFPTFDPVTSTMYFYNWDTEKFYKSDLTTQKSIALTPFIELGNISDINTEMLWNIPAENVAVMTAENNKIFNIKSKNSSELSNNFIDFLWISNNQLIINFHNWNTQENKLVISNSTGEIVEELLELEPTEEPYFFNFIGYKDNIIYYIFTNKQGYNYLYSINIANKENNQILETPILSAKLSPDSQKIIYNTQQNLESINHLYYLDSLKNEQLNINTDINNIIWGNDSKTLYLISGLTTNSEDETPNDADYIILDKIEKYNLENQQTKSTINIIDQGKYGAENLFLSQNDEILYFVNHADTYLYSINLK